MKKAVKWSMIAATLAAVTAIAALPWSYWDTSIQSQLARQVRDTTGLVLKTSEPVTVALLPRPHIKFRSVTISDRWETLNIETEVLKGNLRLLPLLAGRLEVSSLFLYLPTISLNGYGRPLHDRGAIASASTAAKSSRQALDADAASLAAITISGGRLLIKDGQKQVLSQVGDINAKLEWPRIKSPAAFSGEFIWRGEKVSLDANVSNPGQLLRDQTSPVTIEITSRLLDLQLKGKATSIIGSQFQGSIIASSKAIRPLLSMTGSQWPLPAAMSSVSVRGQINVRNTSTSLTDLTLDIDGSRFSGALAILNRGTRPVVTATLATTDLVIDHRSANFPQLTDSDGKWNRASLPLQPLTIADIDLRLSAENARFDDFSAQDIAIVALARNGSLELTVSSPQAYGGNFNANLKLERGPAIPALSGAINFRGIDAKAFLYSAGSRLRISGISDGEIQFRSAGDNFADITSLLSGSLKLNLSKGAITGIDLVKALNLARTLPLSIPDGIRSGETLIEKGHLHANITEGRIMLTDARLDSGAVYSAITGEISLPNRQLNLAIKAREAREFRAASKTQPAQDPADKSPKANSLDLDVTGNWSRPSIAPNPDSLILRSKAAESLIQDTSAPPAAKAIQARQP